MIISVKDGKTPYIGANGNWWIGETDTGVKASSGGSGVTVHTATIGTVWSSNAGSAVKFQLVAIEGVTADNTAIVDHVYTDGTDFANFVEAENQYLNYITNGYAKTYDGGVVFWIFGDAPTVEIPIIVEVV